MKSLLKRTALTCAYLASSLISNAQTNENFDSRPGVHAGAVINYLENHCWQFSNFIASANQPALHGDGSLISIAGSITSNLYTPALNTWSGFSFSFTYAFDGSATESRSINIYLVDANNEIVSLVDNIDASGAVPHTTYTYSKTLSSASNVYKLHINYQGGGSSVRLKLDDLKITASQRYTNGCNESPVAVNDVIAGTLTRHATGTVIGNDIDPNGEAFSCYLINDSKDGRVTLNTNGDFSFIPNEGFAGNTTSFTYRACDQGYNPLCSEETKVTINFPGVQAAQIHDLQANHISNKVTLKWNASTETGITRFEIERSTDGSNFEKTGELKVREGVKVPEGYSFDDRVPEKTSSKNDLYYRLKLVNGNSVPAYSKILLVRVFKTKTLQAVSVTPNPAVNDIKVHLQLNEPAYVVIRLRSINGDEVKRSAVKAYQGDNSFAIEGSEHVKKGVYMLEVIVNSNERMMVKLIKN